MLGGQLESPTSPLASRHDSNPCISQVATRHGHHMLYLRHARDGTSGLPVHLARPFSSPSLAVLVPCPAPPIPRPECMCDGHR